MSVIGALTKPTSKETVRQTGASGPAIVHKPTHPAARRHAAAAHPKPVPRHVSAPSIPAPSQAPPSAAAQKLAEDEAGKHLSASDPLVLGIARHLSSLDAKCRGSDVTVAGAIDFASQDLAKNGIDQSRSSYAAELDKNIKGFPPNFDCAGFVAADLVLREKTRK